ncbi:SIS domain-containing protein [Anaerosporobacter faecicola]|uniref:SIS domain-containing protein n=1 Tax=Anaerosporobacter faecicola TaxID=2718714 RepID=UPI00143C9F51|nr:SIS domain-containing protein [Anaerosporobacter faecicola]
MITYFENILETLNESVHSLDEKAFTKLVDESIETLEKGNKIVVSGLGKNVPVCDKFVGTMNSLGQNACFMNTNSAVHGDIGMVKENDLVIILTKSGETAESIYLTDLLKKRNANLWLLSFEQESTLQREIGKCIILDLPNEGDQWNIVPNNSTTVNLIVLQGLAMQIVKRRGVTLEDFKKNHPGGHIGVQLKNV